jgi:hypothetical protein
VKYILMTLTALWYMWCGSMMVLAGYLALRAGVPAVTGAAPVWHIAIAMFWLMCAFIIGRNALPELRFAGWR